MDDIAIKISGLSKKYILGTTGDSITIAERFRQLIKQRKKNAGTFSKDFYALRNIDLEIKRGETIGIIGKNGAGKSTLLKIISQITEPTEGKIEIVGKVASVLEVGMGFHPELTGRENIFLSGTMLGIPKKQIVEKFDEIVDFSGVKRFIDTPVKHYSSGMYVRLAFSVVANIDADILLFDEVLSVGDLAFQIKCAEKIKQLTHKNKTILLVSHNIKDIRDLCTKVLCLKNGFIEEQGETEVIYNYFEDALLSKETHTNISSLIDIDEENISEEQKPKIPLPVLNWDNEDAPKNTHVKLLKVSATAKGKNFGASILPHDTILFEIEYERLVEGAYVGISLSCYYMNELLFISTPDIDEDNRQTKHTGVYKTIITIPSNFFNIGLFFFSLNFTTYLGAYTHSYFKTDEFLYLKILNPYDGSSSEKEKTLYASFQCPIRPLFERKEEKIQ